MLCRYLLILCLLGVAVNALNRKVLFVGNSYTKGNNLPNLVKSLASNGGHNLEQSQHTVGGATMGNHAENGAVLSKIQSKRWDYVVLQAQSQEGAQSQGYVNFILRSYARDISEQVRENNACSDPMFFMTWGRQYSDDFDAYVEMDDKIRQAYIGMGEDNEAPVAPVGVVWRYLRLNHPEITLYTRDGSHPSYAGSYAAAATFYTMIFQDDPTKLSFRGSLNAGSARKIRAAVKTVLFGSGMNNWVPQMLNFTAVTNGLTVQLESPNVKSDSYAWRTSDGATFGDSPQASHTFASPGTYTVSLTKTYCRRSFLPFQSDIYVGDE
mmetsp:Transcript_7667/g.21756  ORF Transcript_7667/g.21756 Transcript_7667/m.21756 type:complete len:324 (+) Transcript_7667:50-1021(+)|eukprot:CAMPEP_0119129012 /NCGR_PEP_ID=MMETSP1310-20130426/6937_1 /TAXON_ID=464262 /ORGANISM="Genus nov. species nov., Strain RCC2339" /LENGTH=323 /DNA_ID=CAMNT_0007119407 /DNA_START=50 /DNA_END=1021 /DNA_ORIENTATION=-